VTDTLWAVPCPHCSGFYLEVALPAHIASRHPGEPLEVVRTKGPERIAVVLDRALRNVTRRDGK
jgi:hypothetical protein